MWKIFFEAFISYKHEKISVPSTVVLRKGYITDWYYTSTETNLVTKKTAEECTRNAVLTEFEKLYSDTSFYPVYFISLPEHDFETRQRLSLSDLREIVTGKHNKSGILQERVVNSQLYEEWFSACWTPNFVTQERKRISSKSSLTHSCIDRGMEETQYFEVNSKRLIKNIHKNCSMFNVALKVKMYIYVTSMQLHLAQDKAQTLFFLFPTQLSFKEDPSRAPNFPDMVNKISQDSQAFFQEKVCKQCKAVVDNADMITITSEKNHTALEICNSCLLDYTDSQLNSLGKLTTVQPRRPILANISITEQVFDAFAYDFEKIKVANKMQSLTPQQNLKPKLIKTNTVIPHHPKYSLPRKSDICYNDFIDNEFLANEISKEKLSLENSQIKNLSKTENEFWQKIFSSNLYSQKSEQKTI